MVFHGLLPASEGSKTRIKIPGYSCALNDRDDLYALQQYGEVHRAGGMDSGRRKFAELGNALVDE